MIPVFSGGSADEVWQLAAAVLREDSNVRFQPSRAGNTREILHTVLEIRDPRQRWIGSRVPAINPAFAIAEVVWILRGRSDAAFLLPWNRQLPQFSGDGEDYYAAYGARLTRHFGIDQLERARCALSANPDTRQVVLQIWDPAIDFPHEDGSARSPDIPCNITAVLKVRDGRLDWLQVLRSNDLVLGVPYNIVQFTTLQEIVAGWLGVELGTYVQISDSLHVYERDVEVVSRSAKPWLPENTDSLMFDKPDSDRFLQLLEGRIVALGGAERADMLFEAAYIPEAPQSFQNLLAIVGAEAARRHKSEEALERTLSLCSNPTLHELWRRWVHRFTSHDKL